MLFLPSNPYGVTSIHTIGFWLRNKNVHLGILVNQYFYKDANMLEPRSGPTNVGPDLSSSLFASKIRPF